MAKSKKKKSVLGRGLGALLSDTEAVQEENVEEQPSAEPSTIDEIDIDHIEVNPFQPRTDFDQEALQELAVSIKVQGIIQPITVRQLNEQTFQLISGERRLQASRLAGLTTIPAYIRTADDQQMLEMALIENIQRENLNPIEIALSYQRLLTECDLKQEELGDRVGKNRTTVTNYLRLLKLPPVIQAALRDKKISMGHARAIINIDNVEVQLSVFEKIVREGLSVRAVEELVRNLGQSKNKKSTTSTSQSFEIKKLQTQLSSHFGTKIQLRANEKNKGEIKIPFHSVEDLNRILEILNL
ncbi:MAG: ParB/RepB/Spo0J family partition protein [Thermonemataceae bacterium]